MGWKNILNICKTINLNIIITEVCSQIITCHTYISGNWRDSDIKVSHRVRNQNTFLQWKNWRCTWFKDNRGLSLFSESNPFIIIIILCDTIKRLCGLLAVISWVSLRPNQIKSPSSVFLISNYSEAGSGKEILILIKLFKDRNIAESLVFKRLATCWRLLQTGFIMAKAEVNVGTVWSWFCWVLF